MLGNLLSFKINGANIIWLSSKGTLYSSDLTGKSTSKLSSADFPVNLKKEYPRNWQCSYCPFKDVCKQANGDVNWEAFSARGGSALGGKTKASELENKTA